MYTTIYYSIISCGNVMFMWFRSYTLNSCWLVGFCWKQWLFFQRGVVMNDKTSVLVSCVRSLLQAGLGYIGSCSNPIGGQHQPYGWANPGDIIAMVDWDDMVWITPWRDQAATRNLINLHPRMGYTLLSVIFIKACVCGTRYSSYCFHHNTMSLSLHAYWGLHVSVIRH